MREASEQADLHGPSATSPVTRRPGLVMICDVDLGVPDATRTHTVEVAGGFAAQGFAVELLARGPDPKLAGVNYHRAHGAESRRLRRILDHGSRAAALLWRSRRKARRCYVRYTWSSVPTLALARLLGYRVVTQVDDVQYGRGYEREISFAADHVKRLAAMLMGRLAHGVVAVTPQIKALLVEQFHAPAARIAVLPNGVDVHSMTPVARAEAIRRTRLDPGCSYLCFCGRFESWVDFDMLLDAFALVRSSRSDARLLLIGDGPQRERIERRIQALGIEEATVLTGFVEDRRRVRDLIGASTVALMCHSSGYVGRIGVSPTKLAEYLAAGRAVVAKDVPGVREVLVESGAGVVVRGDPRAMADAILALLEPARADELGAIGRRTAEERYTWSSIVRRTIPLFDASAAVSGPAGDGRSEESVRDPSYSSR